MTQTYRTEPDIVTINGVDFILNPLCSTAIGPMWRVCVGDSDVVQAVLMPFAQPGSPKPVKEVQPTA